MNEANSTDQLASTGFVTVADNATQITLIDVKALDALKSDLSDAQRAALVRQGFEAKSGQFAWLEDAAGARVVCGWDGKDNLASLGSLPLALPEGQYAMTNAVSALQILGWGLGSYQFSRYKSAKRAPAKLLLPEGIDHTGIINATLAVGLCRDLINTPAQDMAPSHLEAEVRAMAEQFEARWDVVEGDALLDIGCGAIHGVGRAAADAPRLIDLRWGDESHPKVTVVGKGVTFDSGGLNIKPGASMRLMKKDMGGAANAIGLAYLIMAQDLPVRLRLLVPAAENAISGNAFRPGDILHTHKGLTVEIDNTDAEGRLLLCDALSIACDEKPEAVFDFATLTGSARSAVGAEIAGMFCNDDALAAAVSDAAQRTDDAVARLPLHADYNYMLNSKVADLVNCAPSPYAGAITAALFLERFVSETAWMHFDIMAYNIRNRPAHPEGGEAMGLRAVYDYLERTYDG
ncbi:MAG: leucyl aminopeptidase family protein [Pseudomonadota bacterium]